MKSSQKENSPLQNSDEETQITSQQIVKSEYYQQYIQISDRYKSYTSVSYTNFLHRIQYNKQVQYKQQFIEDFRLKINEQSINRQIVVLTAQWGHFSINIKVLHVNGNNFQHSEQINSGAYGVIYHGELNQENFSMKCIPRQTKHKIQQTLKQYFLAKLASLAGVGPNMLTYFGFDIVIFGECIQFGMEICENVTVHNSKQWQLYQNLFLLHQIGIVHQDIKPENVMYSPNYDRCVFIDFGLSRMVSQKIGYKTFTNYVGCINFWGPQMHKCFTDKTPRHIDLYYNDFFSLKGSIKSLKEFIQSKPNFNQEIYQLIQKPLQVYRYLFLAQEKYFLYQNKINDFVIFWKNFQHQFTQNFSENYCQTQILLFLQQLTPTRQILAFFEYFITNKHKETPIYLRLKVFFEISQKNLCSLEFFRNGEKYKFFSTFLEEYLKQINDELSLHQLIIDKQYILSISFMNYLQKFLNYTSYINNKHQVNEKQRFSAAKVYYQLFLSNQLPEELQTRNMMQIIIIHAIGWCLKNTLDLKQTYFLSNLLFMVHDFLVILDIGTPQQYLMWIEAIYNHKILTPLYRKLFLLRVQQSSNLNLIRILTKKGTSRYYFYCLVNNQVQKKNQQFSKEYPYYRQLTFDHLGELPQKFIKFYGFQIVEFSLLRCESLQQIRNEQKYIQLYNKILNKQKQEAILYFMPLLYRLGARNRDSRVFCNQMERIFKRCLRDQSLMTEFSFFFETELILKETVYQTSYKNLTIQKIESINEYSKKIDTEDLYMFKETITNIWNAIQLKQNMEMFKLPFLYTESGMIFRFFDGFWKVIRRTFLNQTTHSCSKIVQTFGLLMMSVRISSQKQLQIISFLSDKILQEKQQCTKCKQLRKIIPLVCDLYHIQKQMLFLHSKYFQCPKQKEQMKNKMIQKFCSCYNNFKLNIPQQKCISVEHFLLIQRGLHMGQIFCCIDYNFQEKFSGNLNYYEFLSKHKQIRFYFSMPQLYYRLNYILWLLKYKDIKMFVNFLNEIAEYFFQALRINQYGVVQHYLSFMFRSFKEQQIAYLFRQIKISEKQNSNNNKYIIMIYSYMACFADNVSLFHKIVASVHKNVDRLHSKFQREVAINIFGKFVFRDMQLKKRKRQWIYYNNRLVKLLMISGRTISAKKKIKQCSKQVRYLKKKVEKFQVWKNSTLVAKFHMK